MHRQPGTRKYEQLLIRCRNLDPIPTAVAYPCERSALAGAMEAGAKGLIAPILVGPAKTIYEIARTEGIDVAGVRVVDVPDSHTAAQFTVGQQLGPNLYLKVQEMVGDASVTNLIVEYAITNWLRLQTNIEQGTNTQQSVFRRTQGTGADLIILFTR